MLKAYSVDKVVILKFVALDEWNEPEDAASETIEGYVTWKTRLIRNVDGEQVVSSGDFLTEIDLTIDHRDKLQIDSVKYPIIKIERGKHFSNVWTKVYFE